MTEMTHGAAKSQTGEAILPRWWRTVDKVTIVAVLLLFTIGLLLSLASSPPLAQRNDFPPFYYVKKQAIFGSAALVVMVITSIFELRRLRRLAVIGFGISLVALMLLPIFGTDFGKGAVRWYSLGFGSVQPSEFLKPFFVVMVAWLMAASFDLGGPPGRLASFVFALVVVGFLVLQPDFGQACLVMFTWCVMYFVAGAPIVLLVGLAALAVIGGVIAYSVSEHFARRINGFLDPEINPLTQIGYATTAIREGGVFGVGVGEGQVKFNLPDAHTDFIIAVAAEEYGFICVAAILLLYGFIIVRALFRLMAEKDPFARFAGTGLACILGTQAMINMGVAVRLLPAKGMTLPFVSYGGSSVIASGIAAGMLLAFTRKRPQGRIGEILSGGR